MDRSGNILPRDKIDVVTVYIVVDGCYGNARTVFMQMRNACPLISITTPYAIYDHTNSEIDVSIEFNMAVFMCTKSHHTYTKCDTLNCGHRINRKLDNNGYWSEFVPHLNLIVISAETHKSRNGVCPMSGGYHIHVRFGDKKEEEVEDETDDTKKEANCHHDDEYVVDCLRNKDTKRQDSELPDACACNEHMACFIECRVPDITRDYQLEHLHAFHLPDKYTGSIHPLDTLRHCTWTSPIIDCVRQIVSMFGYKY